MSETNTIVKVRNLKKYFELRKGFLSIGKDITYVKAVDGVDFDMRSGEILGLVGESGCGKTTVGRLLTRLEDPTDGFVFFLGRDIALIEGQDVKVFRRNIQMVFQDPYESLNPRTTVTQTIMEPLLNHHIGESPEERLEMVVQAMEDAGLAPAKEYLNRFPHELSGGQRQRVAIARALAVKPRVIVADEPVSMLDVSIRAGVLNLMLDLREKYGIPYLFITHDIAVARYISDRMAVMYLGRVVELAETDEVISNPKHPYTQALLLAVPVPDPDAKHGRIDIKGEVPSAADIPLGCRFRPRCPKAFKGCGWEARDFIDWLGEKGYLAEDNKLRQAIASFHPDGFVLRMTVNDGADPNAVVDLVKDLVAEGRRAHPLLDSVEVIDTLMTDRVIEIDCRPAPISADALAAELFTLLESTVAYEEPDHPMHGIIADMRLEKNRLIVSVGDDAQNLKLAEAFLEDYIRHHRRRNRPEFKGVKSISASPANMTVTLTCVASKEPAVKTAEDVAAHIEKRLAAEGTGDLAKSTLPIETKKKRVRVRILGPESNWSRLLEALKELVTANRKEDEGFAQRVSRIRIKTVKKPQKTVATKFIRAEEPPLFDVGEGHQVACYLFKGGRLGQPPATERGSGQPWA
ncbi:MAG: ATP-binding cassette domain-containing protein [Methanobacteriota archaeon]|nr:MAG: ATP-binding cassette domain-containing protein [Euryarchaeota archaeon]